MKRAAWTLFVVVITVTVVKCYPDAMDRLGHHFLRWTKAVSGSVYRKVVRLTSESASPAMEHRHDLDVFAGCGLEGDARSAAVRALDRLKNRYEAPKETEINPRITLAAVLAPGNDSGRWEVQQGAAITGYVADVKVGGVESTNCHARGRESRDTHIELVLEPNLGEEAPSMIVEITPRLRQIMREQGSDWSTGALRARYLGKWVKVRGWMLFDKEHQNASTNTASSRARIWRATAWEVHPVTSIEPAVSPQNSTDHL